MRNRTASHAMALRKRCAPIAEDPRGASTHGLAELAELASLVRARSRRALGVNPRVCGNRHSEARWRTALRSALAESCALAPRES